MYKRQYIYRKWLALFEAKPICEVGYFALGNDAPCAHFGANIAIVNLLTHVNAVLIALKVTQSVPYKYALRFLTFESKHK